MLLLLMGSLFVLALWTILDALKWERVELDSESGENIGRCTCNNELAYLGPLVVFIAIPLCLTAMMAQKTSDVDDAYSEGQWIYVLLVIHLEAIIVALPIVYILRDISTDARFFGFMTMLWVFPISTLGIVALPKVTSCWNDLYGSKEQPAKRGARCGNTVVTGVNTENVDLNDQQHFAT
jgi:hypothetical protein